jgi:hypothetical protein
MGEQTAPMDRPALTAKVPVLQRTGAPSPSRPAPTTEAQLEEIAGLARNGETARRALARIGEILPRLTTPQDSVRALYHRGEAQLSLEDQVAGCATLASIKRMPAAKYTVSASSLYGLAACEP